eukprot:10061493-Alexandrium_andersonii.AAC.1
MAFVDPAGLHHIQTRGPKNAGGAAGYNYQWLGIRGDAAFPEDVRQAITREGQAKFHAYGADGEKKCIHAVGPDFRDSYATEEPAIQQLEEVYTYVFHELFTTRLKQLRLLPISG